MFTTAKLFVVRMYQVMTFHLLYKVCISVNTNMTLQVTMS